MLSLLNDLGFANWRFVISTVDHIATITEHFGSQVVKTKSFVGTTDTNGNIYSQHLTVADHLILYVDVGADKACTVFQGGGLTHYNYHISSYTSWNIGTGVSISATAYYVDK